MDRMTFAIADGRLTPSRKAAKSPDLRLRTSTEGFFRFFRSEATPYECGDLEGPADLAQAFQTCFKFSTVAQPL